MTVHAHQDAGISLMADSLFIMSYFTVLLLLPALGSYWLDRPIALGFKKIILPCRLNGQTDWS
jgi:hypothetical protein